MTAPSIFEQNLSLPHLLLMLLLLFGGPSIRIDAVQNITSVMVHGSQSSHDAKALILRLANTSRTLIERIVH